MLLCYPGAAFTAPFPVALQADAFVNGQSSMLFFLVTALLVLFLPHGNGSLHSSDSVNIFLLRGGLQQTCVPEPIPWAHSIGRRVCGWHCGLLTK